MSIFNKLKQFVHSFDPEDEMDEDSEMDEFEDDIVPFSSSFQDDAESEARDAPRCGAKVVSISQPSLPQVVTVKPERFESVSDLADHLMNMRTIVLNLEAAEKDVARRIVDFMSGAVYTNDATMRKISESVYIIAPHNVDLLDDQE